jgi:hypothetical protein
MSAVLGTGRLREEEVGKMSFALIFADLAMRQHFFSVCVHSYFFPRDRRRAWLLLLWGAYIPSDARRGQGQGKKAGTISFR